jgi:hypothetical protein
MGVMVTQALSDNATNWLQLLLAVCYVAWSGRISLEEIAEEAWKFTTQNAGISVRIRGA